MKLTVALLTLAAGVMAMPNLQPRQSPVAVTDELSFQLSLPQFTARRNARDPPTLDWSTDGCTSSPDNPLGFDFVPACHRHDFGYHNFRDQGRFTESNKLRIDNQFKKDLYFQCQSESPRFICNGLAEVYYAAVRAFGGDDATPGKRDEDLVAIYEEKLAIYNDMVEEAKAFGILPELE
ncbi:hypothetical protein ACRE_067260 [Hapsidospora chrysogenum ATCC 11550]|uniref:Secretory phospholipase A2 n=1 Tax=Hapsidospora chrysogenum (strain ATCC 11550 / CBS 779.69 / DSM 880 / IAM 14645 / JCM 23072 / IMI 49137) TaxID=857340 RepID=A0A086SZM8_HAPC1|nr:hypothetical protein ACRE_067260 [Hapsidospora chrysogenum ATCC 11550]